MASTAAPRTAAGGTKTIAVSAPVVAAAATVFATALVILGSVGGFGSLFVTRGVALTRSSSFARSDVGRRG
jgi:hypothetical protein